jgi:hypothetical protein
MILGIVLLDSSGWLTGEQQIWFNWIELVAVTPALIVFAVTLR